ncbi:hypothetical protein [Thermaurantiacus sp.]
MRKGLGFPLVAFAALALAPPASAQQKSATKADWAMTAPGSATILFMRPEIRVGMRGTGGLFEPDREMTEAARRNLGAALAARKAELGLKFVEESEALAAADPQLLAQYHALFKSVAEAVFEYQFFPGNRLPTKKRSKGLDYSLGPEIARLTEGTGADYALFVMTEDQYATAGRKVASILAAGLWGVYVPTGEHIGYAGLVDLKTGDLVWINADIEMGGDPREPEGADKRSRQLLLDFPLGQAPMPARP